MIKIVDGNILESNADIIVHQVNCMGVMGAGLAKQIRDKHPIVYTEYKKLCDSTDRNKLLGKVQPVSSGYTMFINIFSQLGYGRDKRYTDYEALLYGLNQVKAISATHKFTVAIPYGIGCGLAGGDWEVVCDMINSVFGKYEHLVTIYKIK